MKKSNESNILLIKVLTLEIRLISLFLTLASSREPAEPNAGSMGVLPHPTAKSKVCQRATGFEDDLKAARGEF